MSLRSWFKNIYVETPTVAKVRELEKTSEVLTEKQRLEKKIAKMISDSIDENTKFKFVRSEYSSVVYDVETELGIISLHMRYGYEYKQVYAFLGESHKMVPLGADECDRLNMILSNQRERADVKELEKLAKELEYKTSPVV